MTARRKTTRKKKATRKKATRRKATRKKATRKKAPAKMSAVQKKRIGNAAKRAAMARLAATDFKAGRIRRLPPGTVGMIIQVKPRR